MDVEKSMREILEAESKAILNIPVTAAYEAAVAAIVERVHHRGGKLVTAGMGKAGQIAMHGDLGVLQPNDIVLLISNSGKTREIIELVDLLHGLYEDIPLIVITGAPDSPLAKAADIALFTGNAPEVCPLGLTPTTSTTVMTVIGDVLVVNTMKRIGFTVGDYAKRHHGGYLGAAARAKNI